MANVTQFRPSGKGTSHSALSDWDVVSEDALSQGRYSSGSLSSDESDAVIIFGGDRNAIRRHTFIHLSRLHKHRALRYLFVVTCAHALIERGDPSIPPKKS
mmetsp:Transcript_40409/g.65123  ORF Transcript_40409/g.65123 Transcript_40409/m.65123 type:complete len:101 (+) Transcript_40409:171-473(+)